MISTDCRHPLVNATRLNKLIQTVCFFTRLSIQIGSYIYINTHAARPIYANQWPGADWTLDRLDKVFSICIERSLDIATTRQRLQCDCYLFLSLGWLIRWDSRGAGRNLHASSGDVISTPSLVSVKKNNSPKAAPR